ncbi:hypothetical protein AB0395_42065 [Streptosporangium sp. NPDC051023]|uniref:hypothetical protein n=1 Tax=Streptosporangium sp. NPDC051023 TaxID=3155410 RepID=UPI00344BC761
MRKQAWKNTLIPIFATATASLAFVVTPAAFASPASAREVPPSSSGVTAESRDLDTCNRSWHRGRNTQIEVITNGTPQTITNTAWTDLSCGSVNVQVPKGVTAHLTVWVNAEIRCKGPSDTGWCGGRVLADGQLLKPSNEDGTGDFAWDTAEPGIWRWHSGSMIRAGIVKCPADNSTANCDKKITVQVASPNANTEFWVDDTIVRAELIRNS